MHLLRMVAVAFALVIPLGPTLSDEKSDIEAVEQELRAETEAINIYKRAKDWARKAVVNSSAGIKFKCGKVEYAEKMIDAIDKQISAIKKGDVSMEKRYKNEQRRYSMLLSLQANRCGRLIRKMTAKFLTDEIEKAQEKKLRHLERELEKMKTRELTAL